MSTTKSTPQRSKPVTVYPINTKADHKAALAELDSLMDAEPGSPEEDRLKVLVLLIEAYEDIHFPIDATVDPIGAIQFRMEQAGLKQRDLIGIIGTSGRVSEVMNRKRDLTLPMIRALNKELGIPLESLIGEAA